MAASEVVADVTSVGAEDNSAVVLVDVSDLLMYLYHHNFVSGIQRVIAEVLPHLEAGAACRLVAFDAAREQFVDLDQAAVGELLDYLRHVPEGETEGTRRRVVAIQEAIPTAPVTTARPGDVLALLGAAWVYEGLLKAAQRLKEQGAAITVLIFDLIPVVFPGFADAMILQFRQYLPRVAALADRVPAISASSRRDFENYCKTRGWSVPPGGVTRLAGDQWSQDRMARLGVSDQPAWPRPYVLLVSTVESRKNHILALRCWQRLLRELPADQVPDLVCVGRIGWNVFEFLSEFEETAGLGGRIHLLSESVSDARLAALYRDCMFTIYPSRYEGWGLPITESLGAGKPVVCARNTSLVEAGGDFVSYFEDDDLPGFVEQVRSYLADAGALQLAADRIAQEYQAPTWFGIAETLLAEFAAARVIVRAVPQEVEMGAEYGLGRLTGYSEGLEGLGYLEFLRTHRRLPLTDQIAGVERGWRAELICDAAGATRTATGRLLSAGQAISFDFRRPIGSDLHLVVSWSGPITTTLTAATGVGSMRQTLVGGEPLVVALGEGNPGELLHVTVQAAPEAEPTELRSFAVVAGAASADRLSYRSLVRHVEGLRTSSQPSDPHVAAALAQVTAQLTQTESRLESLTASTSWRITKPIRAVSESLRRRRQPPPPAG